MTIAIWIVSVVAILGYIAGVVFYPLKARDELGTELKGEPRSFEYHATQDGRAAFASAHAEWSDKVAEARLHYYHRLFTCLVWPLALLSEVRMNYAEARADMQPVLLRQSTRALKAAEKRQQELAAAKADAQATIDRMTGGAS